MEPLSYFMSILGEKKSEKKDKKESKITHSGSDCPICHDKARNLEVKSDKIECVACGHKYKP